MLFHIPSGVGGTGAGTVAVTSVEVLESPPSGGLQASVRALTSFVNQSTGGGVPNTIKQALPTIKTTGSNS